MNEDKKGFTLIELLVVIAIIGTLAALVVNTFVGAQKKARDTKRKADVAAITKALELYYIDHGEYPQGSGSISVYNDAWSTTADGSWANLANALKPYMGELPRDPISTPGLKYKQNYSYFANRSGILCASAKNQTYILIYDLESEPQKNSLRGPCPSDELGPFAGVSNIRMTKW